MAGDFLGNTAGFVDVFEFEIEDGIDPVLAFERAETIFDPPAGEDGTISGGGLAFDVEFRSPTGRDAVFEFGVRSENEALTRVTGDAPMGRLMRENYWMPFALPLASRTMDLGAPILATAS